MSDQPKPTTVEWTECPVLHGDGSEWQELRYLVDPSGRRHGSMNEQVAIGLVGAINAALADEREKTESIARRYEAERLLRESEIQQLRLRPAAAQQAIDRHNREFGHTCDFLNSADTTALDAAIAAAQQPLVDALQEVESYFSRRTVSSKVQEIVRSALAKVKEGK